jgi:hypothetical protein
MKYRGQQLRDCGEDQADCDLRGGDGAIQFKVAANQTAQ